MKAAAERSCCVAIAKKIADDTIFKTIFKISLNRSGMSFRRKGELAELALTN